MSQHQLFQALPEQGRASGGLGELEFVGRGLQALAQEDRLAAVA